MLDGYEVGSIDCYSKDLDSIETELMLIYQHRGLVKSPAPISAAVSSVSEHIWNTPTPPQRTQMEPALSLSQKLFQKCIKFYQRTRSDLYAETYTLALETVAPSYSLAS